MLNIDFVHYPIYIPSQSFNLAFNTFSSFQKSNPWSMFHQMLLIYTVQFRIKIHIYYNDFTFAYSNSMDGHCHRHCRFIILPHIAWEQVVEILLCHTIHRIHGHLREQKKHNNRTMNKMSAELTKLIWSSNYGMVPRLNRANIKVYVY